MLSEWTKWFAEAPSSAVHATDEAERQRLMLLSKGARLQAGFVERFDHCSLAVLDRDGIVVSWYDGSSGSSCADDAVVHRHVSQFYVPSDIALDVPGRSFERLLRRGSQGLRPRDRCSAPRLFVVHLVNGQARLCRDHFDEHVTRCSRQRQRVEPLPNLDAFPGVLGRCDLFRQLTGS